MNHTNNSNTQFVFDGKLKGFTLGLFALGLVCLALTYFTDSEYDHTIFWTNLLQNAVFFTGISFAALFFICTHTIAWGGWHIVFKRIPEAMMMFLPVGMIFLALVAVAVAMDLPGTDLLYLWSDEDALQNDELVIHKSAFLNPFNYFLTLVVIAIWYLFATIMRKLSTQQDTDANLGETNLFKMRFWSAIFLPIAGFSSAYAIWQWVMSVDPHWYSTLFAWYASVSLWVSAVSITLLLVVFLKSRGLMQHFTPEHMHDLGKYIFGFSVFWTYLWFSQFLLIWYANNGEETQYFFFRFEQFKPVFFINIAINFLLPFFVLMMNSSKRTLGTVGFVAGMVIFGHWLDFYQMIKPGVWYNVEHKAHAQHQHSGDDHNHDAHTTNLNGSGKFDGGQVVLTQHGGDQHGTPATDSTAHDTTAHTTAMPADTHGDDHAGHDHSADAHGAEQHGHDAHAHGTPFVMGIHFPGLLEIGTMLGFLGLFLFVTFTYLSKASLYPKNDPFLEESEHHHI